MGKLSAYHPVLWIPDNQLRYKELFSDHSTNYNSSSNSAD